MSRKAYFIIEGSGKTREREEKEILQTL